MRAIVITLVLKDYQSDKNFRNIAADIFNRLFNKHQRRENFNYFRKLCWIYLSFATCMA